MDLVARLQEIAITTIADDLGYEVNVYGKICCPFHQDDTPSLVFYNTTNSFYCFGCGKSGNGINFFSEAAQVSLGEAIRQMAQRYLTDSPSDKPRRSNRPNPDLGKVKRLDASPPEVFSEIHIRIYEAFRDFCLQQPTNALSQEAHAYLRSRGFHEQTIRDFRIFALKDYTEASWWLKTQFSLLDLRESGLFNDRDNLIFYKHPIIIPYYKNDRLVYLQGRVIGQPPEGFHKYMWLQGRPVTLFNVDTLRGLKIRSLVYLTEGAFDCMTLSQEGIPAISLGSANVFKRAWAGLFKRYEVCFYLDNDAAGHRAADELETVMLQLGILTRRRYKNLGSAKDINEFYRGRTKGQQGDLF